MANVRLSGAQVAQVAYNAGFRGDDLVTMVALAKVESGWNTDPEGPGPQSGHFGLWQIAGSHGPYTRAQLANPQTNANAAYKLYQGRGGAANHGGNFADWIPWETPPGAYRLYLPESRAAVAAMGKGGINVPAGGVLDASSSSSSTDNPGIASSDYHCTFTTHKGWGGSVPLIGGALKGITGGVADTPAALGYIACIIEKAAIWISDTTNWIRILQVAIGGVLILRGAGVMTNGAVALPGIK